MTSLDLSPQSAAMSVVPTDPPVRRVIERIPWATLLPWAVVALMFFGDGYHRLQSGQEQLTSNQTAIEKLEGDIADLRLEVRELKAIVSRIERAQVRLETAQRTRR